MEETTAHHDINYTIPKFSSPSPSQYFILGMVPTSCWSPTRPPSLCLQCRPAGRCCCILFFMESLRNKHHLSLSTHRSKDAFKESLELVWKGRCEAPERMGTGNSSFQKPFDC